MNNLGTLHKGGQVPWGATTCHSYDRSPRKRNIWEHLRSVGMHSRVSINVFFEHFSEYMRIDATTKSSWWRSSTMNQDTRSMCTMSIPLSLLQNTLHTLSAEQRFQHRCSFCSLTVGACLLTVEFLCLQLVKVLTRCTSHCQQRSFNCKQKSSTVSRKLPIVSKKAVSFQHLH